MTYPNKLTPEWLEERIVGIYYPPNLAAKTTICTIVLDNGFEITDSSSCVNPADYDENIGKEFALKKCKERLWELYGFVLTEAKYRDLATDWDVVQ